MSNEDKYSLKTEKSENDKFDETENNLTKFDEDSPEEKKFYEDVEKTLGIDKPCLINVSKIYNLTVATNMLITLIVVLILANTANYFKLFNHNYLVSELFLTAMVIFTILNLLMGYSLNSDRYEVSTNMSALFAMFILPFLHVGPEKFFSNFC